MPMITVRYVTPNATDNLQAEIADLARRLAAEKLRKDPSVTAVLAEPANPDAWFVAGERPTKKGLSAFWFDIKVTANTNTKDEIANFVAETFASLSSLLGPTHEESYVLVHAPDGDFYGYGGRTQNARWSEDRGARQKGQS